MLTNLKTLHGCKLAASDGDIGHVKDFYFDDKAWVVRYMVADTGSWMSGREVLLSPHAFGRLEDDGKLMHINLTRKQIEDSPSIEAHKPVSRQYEIEYYRYYGWPAYWYGGAMWGLGGYPVIMAPSKDELADIPHHKHHGDRHLQSAHAISGYHIQTVDGVLGCISSLLVDDRSWAVRNLVVEAGHWYSGKEILIPTAEVERISYEESKVFVSITKEKIQQAAESEKAGATT